MWLRLPRSVRSGRRRCTVRRAQQGVVVVVRCLDRRILALQIGRADRTRCGLGRWGARPHVWLDASRSADTQMHQPEGNVARRWGAHESRTLVTWFLVS